MQMRTGTDADHRWPIVLNDTMTREEFNALGIPMSDDTDNCDGKDGVADHGKVRTPPSTGHLWNKRCEGDLFNELH